MTPGRRGRLLLLAQRPGPPLGPPPADLDPTELQAWRDIVAVAPDVLRHSDGLAMEMAARSLAWWRADDDRARVRELLPEEDHALMRAALRECYRWLGELFIPMAERRRLLFPDPLNLSPPSGEIR